MSGPIPNWSRSSILFSKKMCYDVRAQIKVVFPVADFDQNSMHLGHPLIISHRDKNKTYDFIYQKFKTRLTLTKANTLNHAGRLTLIQSVFASIPIYYMANILFSKKFLAKLSCGGARISGASEPMMCTEPQNAQRAWKDMIVSYFQFPIFSP